MPEETPQDDERDRRAEELAEQASGSGSPHTSEEEGHPAGEGPRSARDIGGPTAADDEGDETGGATGTRPNDRFETHE